MTKKRAKKQKKPAAHEQEPAPQPDHVDAGHSTEGAPVQEEHAAEPAAPVKTERKPRRSFFHRKKADEIEAPATTPSKKEAKDSVSESTEQETFNIEVQERTGETKTHAFFTTINYVGMGKYRTQFVQGVATMLTAGLPLIESLEAYKMEVRAKSMKKVIDKVLTSVNGGVPLWRAMDTTHFFSSYEIALVRIGEEAGNLARNMEYLAEQQEKDRSLKAKVKMAMIYPSIVLTLMFVIVMGLGIFVLPNLVQVLYSLNADLPLTTRIVIKVTQFFEKHGMVVAPLSIVGIILFALLAKFTRFRGPAQKILFMIPGIGSLAYDATIARFGVILGGLLRAGVPLVQALESLVEVTTVVSYKRMYQTMLTRITVGDSFSKCFAEIRSTKKLLPPSVQQLIVTGERSGTLSETLMKIATIYEKKAEETAEKLPTILEPMLLLIIGGLVGTIAFAIITPIYSVVGNLN